VRRLNRATSNYSGWLIRSRYEDFIYATIYVWGHVYVSS